MKRIGLVVSSLACLFMVGCGAPPQAIDASAIDVVVHAVAARHDAMVNGNLDPRSISAEDRVVYLRSTALLTAAVDTAMGRKPVVSTSQPVVETPKFPFDSPVVVP